MPPSSPRFPGSPIIRCSPSPLGRYPDLSSISVLGGCLSFPEVFGEKSYMFRSALLLNLEAIAAYDTFLLYLPFLHLPQFEFGMALGTDVPIRPEVKSHTAHHPFSWFSRCGHGGC